MNRLLAPLLIASLAGPVLSGPAVADPGFIEETWILAHKGGDQDRADEYDQRKLKERRGKKKKQEQVEDTHQDRAYGYGYERRNLDKYTDDRGRR